MNGGLRLVVRVGLGFLRLIYAAFKLGRKRNRLVLIGTQSDEPSLDIRFVAQALQAAYPEVEICVTAGKVKRSLSGAFAFVGTLLRQMRLIASARVVVLEGYCIAASVFNHRPGTCIVQMWHSLDAFKKFGFQISDLVSGTSSKNAKLMRMHQGYTHIICASAATEPFFKAAFQARDAQFVRLGLPRVDYIASLRRDPAGLCSAGAGLHSADIYDAGMCEADFKNSRLEIRKSILRRYPTLSGRPIVVYAPTFRDGRPTNMTDLVSAASDRHFSLVLKLHPLERDNDQASGSGTEDTPQRRDAEDALGHGADGLPESLADEGGVQSVCIADSDFQTADWFALVDAVITDYSGIALESAIAGIPTFLYLYDAEEYTQERGLNIDFAQEAIAKYIYTDAAAMLAAIDRIVASKGQIGLVNTVDMANAIAEDGEVGDVANAEAIGVADAKDVADALAVENMVSAADKTNAEDMSGAEDRGADALAVENMVSAADRRDAEDMADVADGYDFVALKAFRDKYAECGDTGNTEKLAVFLAGIFDSQDTR